MTPPGLSNHRSSNEDALVDRVVADRHDLAPDGDAEALARRVRGDRGHECAVLDWLRHRDEEPSQDGQADQRRQ